MIRFFEPKTEIPILGLISSSSKTNRTSGIKVSKLEASGQAVLTPKKKLHGSLPANPVNDRRVANAVTLKNTFLLP